MSAPTKIPPSQTLTEFGQLVNGGVSNFAMLCLMQPVFTLKTYVMSGQGLPAARALYRGFGANCVGVLPAQSVAFFANALAMRRLGGEPTGAQKLSAGLFAGAAGAPLATVFERVMIVQQLGKTKISAGEAIAKIVAQDDLQGLLKGLTPTVVRDSLFTGGLFGLREIFRQALTHSIPHESTRDSVAGVSAGGVAGWLSAPADRIKTLMQGDLTGSYSALKTTLKVVRQESVRGLFKGSGVRALLVGGVMLTVGKVMDTTPPYFPNGLRIDKI